MKATNNNKKTEGTIIAINGRQVTPEQCRAILDKMWAEQKKNENQISETDFKRFITEGFKILNRK